MRNFYNQPTSKIFDKMFGKGARQLQADPTLDLGKCNCCNTNCRECKSCMEGHVIGITAGCCHSKNQGLIYEYERPAFYGQGMECCPDIQSPCCPVGETCPPDLVGNPLPICNPDNPPRGVKRCCPTGKKAASNVRFFYNYVGQYFKFDYTAVGKGGGFWPNNGRPRLCSYCDPTSISQVSGGTIGDDDQKCLDRYPIANIDDDRDTTIPDDLPCNVGSEIPFSGCQCRGNDPGDPLRDTNSAAKRLSRYRKRQMERNPYYRWLLDIMCYDNGNRILSPYYTYQFNTETAQYEETPNYDNGTLYDHLVCVVHCEHWYEIARCPQNPYHEDENGILGGWIRDPITNQPIGANTSLVAPRFWIYACSGVPLFDFDFRDARKKGYISETDYQTFIENLANKQTPKQDLLQKMNKGGYFDTGDWRQEALNEIKLLKGLSFTKDFYGGISGNSDLGACCIIGTGPDELNYSCITTSGATCGLCGGVFFAGEQCNSATCVSCNGFKPHTNSNPYEKYLGPVRKRLWVPEGIDGGIGIFGVSGPARLDPKKARINEVSPTPALAKAESLVNETTDKTLVNLQLPDDLIKEPWTLDGSNGGRTYPNEPLPGGQGTTEEWKQFKIWRDSQWLYMHARPGGWDYVCGGFVKPPEPGEEAPEVDWRIPDLPRRYSNIGNAPGGCLAGAFGYPQESFEFNGGCPNINCGYRVFDGPDEVIIQYPVVGCGYEGSCLSIACSDTSFCSAHPEQGGGPTKCEGLAFAAGCDGMRFTYYRHRFVVGSDAYDTHMTCGDSVNSFLFTVNKETGNYSEFCPHVCRGLNVPQRIANAIPQVYSNRLSHGEVCQGIINAQESGFVYPGRQCDGLYCYTNFLWNAGDIPDPPPDFWPWYGPIYTNQSNCCGGRRNAQATQAPPPTDPNHNAAACIRYPGPGYPALYDGKFVGQQVNFNPLVCCWYCPEEGSLDKTECFGAMRYFECLNKIQERDPNTTQPATGKGFLYIPDNVPNASTCCNLSPICACSAPSGYSANCEQDDGSEGTPPGGGGGPL